MRFLNCSDFMTGRASWASTGGLYGGDESLVLRCVEPSDHSTATINIRASLAHRAPTLLV